MSDFAVAAFHDARLPSGASAVDAVVWIRALSVEEPGADVSLRVWTPLGAKLEVLREIAPGTSDVLDGAVRVDERTVEGPAGRWRDGAREYELRVALPPRGAGEELLAARVAVVAGGEVAGVAKVVVTWIAGAPVAGTAAAGPDAGAPAAGTAGAGPDAGALRAATRDDGPCAADLPTGPSPSPRAALAHDLAAGGPCPGCGSATEAGDRYCEGCGAALAAG